MSSRQGKCDDTRPRISGKTSSLSPRRNAIPTRVSDTGPEGSELKPRGIEKADSEENRVGQPYARRNEWLLLLTSCVTSESSRDGFMPAQWSIGIIKRLKSVIKLFGRGHWGNSEPFLASNMIIRRSYDNSFANFFAKVRHYESHVLARNNCVTVARSRGWKSDAVVGWKFAAEIGFK